MASLRFIAPPLPVLPNYFGLKFLGPPLKISGGCYHVFIRPEAVTDLENTLYFPNYAPFKIYWDYFARYNCSLKFEWLWFCEKEALILSQIF